MTGKRRYAVVLAVTIALIPALLAACLLCGSVSLSASDVWHALTGAPTDNPAASLIVTQTRLPMACTAMLAGAALSVAGLMLQTSFDNPLAGPSILGISSGASLGVAVVMLGFPALVAAGGGLYAASIAGALVGAGVILLLLISLASTLRSATMLLIAGILVSYLTSSAISLLNFFSTQEGVHSYVIWGLGTFAATTPGRTLAMAIVTLPLTALSLLTVKPLNALLLGERYAMSVGVNLRRDRTVILTIAGVLTAVVTAFCGPIGFIGLAVPHIARLAIGTVDHRRLLPLTPLCGAVVTLLCAWISTLPASGVLPVNAVTPIVGIPVILFIILKRRSIYYLR